MEYIFYVSFQENDFQKYSKAFLIQCTESAVGQKVQELKKKYSEELEGKMLLISEQNAVVKFLI